MPILFALALAMTAQYQWRPHPGPQAEFIQSSAYETLYGGAAGGGKSEALLAKALRHAGVEGVVCDCPAGAHKSYRALLARRTFPELERSLIGRSRVMYGQIGGKYNEQKKVWTFPTGAQIFFAHFEHAKTVHEHQSAEYQFLGFDELTSFTEGQWRYMMSRVRSSNGIPVRVCGATNPGGDGHEWVFRRFGPWLDPEHPNPAAPGEVRWYVMEGDTERWVSQGELGALSRVFIPAKLSDNPTLMQADPGYLQRLGGLDALSRAQLRDGNWLAKAAAGILFRREFFEIVDAAPADVVARIRYWDRAATEPHEANRDPDWTRGVRISRTKDDVFYVEHVAGTRSRPAGVKALLKQTAEIDGKRCIVGIEQDPGQAGVAEAEDCIKLLNGWNARLFKPTGDKVTRAQPVSAQCEAGNVKLVRGPWNESFLAELEQFPDGSHDDQVDGLSGGYNAIAEAKGLARLRMLATL